MVSLHRVIILSPTYIIYRNSEIRNSDSDFSTRNHNRFSDDFLTEICGILGSEAGAVPAEFTTKPNGVMGSDGSPDGTGR